MRAAGLGRFLADSAVGGAALVAILAAVVEAVVARAHVNAALVVGAILAARLCGWSAWAGAGLVGAAFLVLGEASVRLLIALWGVGMFVESVRRWWSARVRGRWA